VVIPGYLGTNIKSMGIGSELAGHARLNEKLIELSIEDPEAYSLERSLLLAEHENRDMATQEDQ